jgi:hypothetical protein
MLAPLLLAICPPTGCIEGPGDGITVGWSEERVTALAGTYPEDVTPDNPTAWYEYVAVIDCIPPNSPTQPRLEICGFAVTFCEENVPDSFGPRSIIYRRTAYADATDPTTWVPLAPTCYTDSVPARSGEPAEGLTEAMILEQFHRTPFALPTTVVQPPDARTLVNLPVYFELAWPQEGFAPQDIDTTTLAGREVRIRPTLIGATYLTGDGTALGPTTSLGGPYPGGDINHTYTDPADVAPYISVEYGGEVSIDGGAWRPIPGSATVEGPPTPLLVLESRNRLYQNTLP